MAESFRKYKWKESSLWILWKVTPELTVEPVVDDLGDPHSFPDGGIPNVKEFLQSVDATGAIPITSNPHSMFAFTSLQNFVAGVHDTINPNWTLLGKPQVSLNTVKVICVLITEKKSTWNSSPHHSFRTCIAGFVNFKFQKSKNYLLLHLSKLYCWSPCCFVNFVRRQTKSHILPATQQSHLATNHLAGYARISQRQSGASACCRSDSRTARTYAAPRSYLIRCKTQTPCCQR